MFNRWPRPVNLEVAFALQSQHLRPVLHVLTNEISLVTSCWVPAAIGSVMRVTLVESF